MVMTMETSADQLTPARVRWNLLAKTVKRKVLAKGDTLPSYSVRKFDSFDLLQFRSVKGRWRRAEISVRGQVFHVEIRLSDLRVAAEDLIGFNNTGNVCVWPSEEILAHFSLKNLDSFRGLRVCELGGGMTSLAGLFVAKYAESVQQVLLTDGNAKSVRNLEAIAERSARRSDFATLPVVRRLRWGEAEDFGDLIGTFDVLLVSDCFYFDESRQSLADTVDRLLSPTGFLLAFAPSRHGTLEKFAALMVSRGFHVFMTTHYDPEVSRRADQLRLTPQFNPDLHHPILLRISRADCRPLHFD